MGKKTTSTNSITLHGDHKPAPQWVPFVCAGLYIMIAVSAVLMIANRDWFYLLWILAWVIGLIAFDKIYSWYQSAELFESYGVLHYEVLDILDMLGNRKTVYRIEKIQKCVRKGNKLFIYGEINHKEPVGKPKDEKKLIILDCTDEAEKLVNEFAKAHHM